MRLTVHRAAVWGRPVGHSLSPLLHRAAYVALGLADWRYDAVECDDVEFPARLAALGPEWVGLSCTMPLKRVALAAAVEVAPAAAMVGAANTLLRTDAGWAAENTDVDGVVGALASVAAPMGAATSVLLLGAGGTAQAVLVALARLGVTAVTVAVRAPARTVEVQVTARRLGLALRVSTFPAAFAADVVVSTLPGAAGAALADRPWSGVQTLFDVGYAPWPTPLAGAAAAAGVRVVGGREMLLHQAARQVELMTGRPAPLTAMRAALPPPS